MFEKQKIAACGSSYNSGFNTVSVGAGAACDLLWRTQRLRRITLPIE
jgi:hypothetical protein